MKGLLSFSADSADETVTVFVVNGSSLGGGEIDSIIRASILDAHLYSLEKVSHDVARLCKDSGVRILKKDEVFAFNRDQNLSLRTSGFLRDLALVPMLISLAIRRLRLPEIEIGVHSDPLGGIVKVSLSARLVIGLFQLYCIIFAARIRFVSVRQLKTFRLLSFLKQYYIDPPTSSITRRGRLGAPRNRSTSRELEIVYIGRLSTGLVMGDAKNTRFIVDFAKMLEKECSHIKIHIYGDGNNSEAIEVLQSLNCVEIKGPTTEIEDILIEAKVVVIPSTQEGYCLIAREAALLGCKVVATRAIAPEVQGLANIYLQDNLLIETWIEKTIGLLE